MPKYPAVPTAFYAELRLAVAAWGKNGWAGLQYTHPQRASTLSRLSRAQAQKPSVLLVCPIESIDSSTTVCFQPNHF